MYAIYWHARDINGTVCIQGHAAARTMTIARKIVVDSKNFAAQSDLTRSWWSCIVSIGRNAVFVDFGTDALEIEACEI